MNFMNTVKSRMKKNDNKGFTLVEIIVVLVILAILAAAMVPAMLGYVEEARGKSFINEARVAYNAGQTLTTEMMALGKSNTDIEAALNKPWGASKTKYDGEDTELKAVATDRLNKLLGKDLVQVMTDGEAKLDYKVGADGNITNVGYQRGGYVVEINVGGTTTAVKDPNGEGYTGEALKALTAG